MITTLPPRVAVGVGTGSLQAFSANFKIYQKSDIICYKGDAANPRVYTKGVVDVDYTVAFDTDAQTLTVTWTVAPVAGGRSVIIGAAVQEQGSSLTREGPLPTQTIEDALDFLTILVQELQEQINRAPLQPIVPALPGKIIVATPVNAKGLKWTDNGDGTWTIGSTTVDIDTVIASAQASAAAAAASAAGASASAAGASVSAASAAASLALVQSIFQYTSGLASALPASSTAQLAFYYATDIDQIYMWILTAGRWRAIG